MSATAKHLQGTTFRDATQTELEAMIKIVIQFDVRASMPLSSVCVCWLESRNLMRGRSGRTHFDPSCHPHSLTGENMLDIYCLAVYGRMVRTQRTSMLLEPGCHTGLASAGLCINQFTIHERFVVMTRQWKRSAQGVVRQRRLSMRPHMPSAWKYFGRVRDVMSPMPGLLYQLRSEWNTPIQYAYSTQYSMGNQLASLLLTLRGHDVNKQRLTRQVTTASVGLSTIEACIDTEAGAMRDVVTCIFSVVSRSHATMMTEGTQLKAHLYMLARVAIGVSINQWCSTQVSAAQRQD